MNPWATKRKGGEEGPGNDKEAQAICELIDRLIPHFNEGKSANTLDVSPEEAALMKNLHLLSSKPIIYAANVADDDLSDADANELVSKVRTYERKPRA